MLACYFLVSAAFLWSKAPALRFLSPPHTHGSSASACAGDSLAGGGAVGVVTALGPRRRMRSPGLSRQGLSSLSPVVVPERSPCGDRGGGGTEAAALAGGWGAEGVSGQNPKTPQMSCARPPCPQPGGPLRLRWEGAVAMLGR